MTDICGVVADIKREGIDNLCKCIFGPILGVNFPRTPYVTPMPFGSPQDLEMY